MTQMTAPHMLRACVRMSAHMIKSRNHQCTALLATLKKVASCAYKYQELQDDVVAADQCWPCLQCNALQLTISGISSAGDMSQSPLSLELSMPTATLGQEIEQAVVMLINTSPRSGQPFVCLITETVDASPTSCSLQFASQHPLRQSVWSRRLKRKSYYVGLWVKARAQTCVACGKHMVV